MSLQPGMGSVTQLQNQIELMNQLIESLRQQLDAAEANCQCELIKLEQQLAESQARDEALRDALVRVSGYEAYMEDKVITNALALPSDSTALDLAISQAKRDGGREALLEAINEWEKPYGLTDGSPFIERLRRMADNLKD